jgi:hypothetical protein
MMLEAVLLNLVAQRIQEVVVRVVMRAENPVRLLDQVAVLLELLRLDGQKLRPVGEQVQMDRYRTVGIEVEPRRIPAGVYRTVDEGFQVDAFELGLLAARGCGFQCRRVLPIDRQLEARLHRNLPGEIAGRVQDQLVPLEEQDVARDLDGADFRAGRRKIVEIDVDRLHPGTGMQVKREDLDRIARPGHRRAVRADPDAREPIDGAFRCMGTRQPLRIQQHGIRAHAAQGLVNVHDTAFQIGGIDLETNLTGICPILRRCDRCSRRDRGWAGACLRCTGGHYTQDGHGDQNLLHRITFLRVVFLIEVMVYQRLTRFSGARYILSPSLTP